MIVINGRFLTQKITGVQRVGIEIVKELDKRFKPDECELITPPGIVNKIELNNINTKIVGKRNGNTWVQTEFANYIKEHGGVSLTLAGLPPVNSPDFFVAHDVTFKAYPQSFNWKFRLLYDAVYKLSFKRCKHVFTVSEFSKREIIKYYSMNSDKITIVYNSSNHVSTNGLDENLLKRWGLNNGEYILSVGSNNIHKNQRFISDLAKCNPNLLFVIVGQGQYKSFTEVTNGLRDNLIYTGYVSNEELYTLYKCSRGFIFPSLYEGFGIPPLEAIMLGVKRVAVSDIPVFREIYDKGVYYFDPNSPEEFSMNEFNNCLMDENEFLYYSSKYSWSESAEAIYGVISNYNII